MLTQNGFEIDYLEIRDAKDLALISKKVDKPARLFIACRLGKTRLIDNLKITQPKQLQK